MTPDGALRGETQLSKTAPVPPATVQQSHRAHHTRYVQLLPSNTVRKPAAQVLANSAKNQDTLSDVEHIAQDVGFLALLHILFLTQTSRPAPADASTTVGSCPAHAVSPTPTAPSAVLVIGQMSLPRPKLVIALPEATQYMRSAWQILVAQVKAQKRQEQDTAGCHPATPLPILLILHGVSNTHQESFRRTDCCKFSTSGSGKARGAPLFDKPNKS